MVGGGGGGLLVVSLAVVLEVEVLDGRIPHHGRAAVQLLLFDGVPLFLPMHSDALLAAPLRLV